MASPARPHHPGLTLALALALQLACSGDDTGATATATAASGITGITSITGASQGSGGESEGASDSDSGGGMKLDLPDDDTDGLPGGADCGSKLPKPGDPDFSIIWIANTGQGTVSKIESVNAANSGVYARFQRVG